MKLSTTKIFQNLQGTGQRRIQYFNRILRVRRTKYTSFTLIFIEL